MIKQHVSLLLAASLAIIALCGCVTESADPDLARTRVTQPAIIAVADPNASIARGASFAWMPGAIDYHADQRLQNVNIRNSIETLIRQNLLDLGYRFVDTSSAHDYSIAYTAALESSLGDTEIMRRFGLLPGNNRVPADSVEYEKGSLIIYVQEAGSRAIVWRAAVQAAVEFAADDSEREQRLDRILHEMFQSFPEHGG